MKKSVAMINTISFIIIIFGLSIGFLIIPDKDFSSSENRYLQSAPSPKAGNIANGKWQSDFNNYINDQFPFRDSWITANSALQRISGRLDNNGVYFGKTLIQTFWNYDDNNLLSNIQSINSFNERNKLNAYFVPIPNACEINCDSLPGFAPDADEKEILSFIKSNCNSEIIDCFDSLNYHKNEKLYYSTDHHMTSLGSYLVYTDISKALKIEPYDSSKFVKKTVSDSFYGTLYNKSGAQWIFPDEIECWNNPACNVVLELPFSKEKHNTLFDETALDKSEKYNYFCFGNQPLEIIKNPDKKGSILVIKDSYANEILPFLANNFGEIHVIDLRYYQLRNIDFYVKENKIETVLYIFNISNFCEDEDLIKIS